MQIPLIVPIQHPAIAGHFPGMPMVPAALLLDEIAHRLSRETDLDINTAKQVRFIAPLEPGQQLDVRYQQKSPAEYRFIGTEKGSPVIKGVLNYTVTELKYVPLTAMPPALQAIPASINELYQQLPHAGSMRLLEQVLNFDEKHITCLTNICPAHPLDRCGQLPTWAGLELAAQALACHGILSRLRNREVRAKQAGLRKAMIIGIREMSCYRPWLNTLHPCRIEVTLMAQQPRAVSCEFTLTQDDQAVSGGQFNVIYETDTE